jgi:hypothetical protein
MDVVFFLSRAVDAVGVTSSHDPTVEPAADPLRVADPSVLLALCECLGVRARLEPLRDATCRSFPVLGLGADLARRLARLDDDGRDRIAADWKARAAEGLDADPWELACCLRDLGEAVRDADDGERLFALLEDRIG